MARSCGGERAGRPEIMDVLLDRSALCCMPSVYK